MNPSNTAYAMPRTRTRTRTGRATLAAGLLCAAGLLALAAAACSAGTGTQPQGPGTVTVTQSSSGTPTPSASPTASSDVKGRGFDVGTVQDVGTVAGVQTIELDRWTVRGTSDTQLSRNGVTIAPHVDQRYLNQNSSRTYTVPVAPGATAVINRCVKAGDQLGLASTPRDAQAWLEDVSDTTVLVLTYDEQGRVTRFDTDPRCTG